MGKPRWLKWPKRSRKSKESHVSPHQDAPAAPLTVSDPNISISPPARDCTTQINSPVKSFEPQDLWGIAFGKLDGEQQAILSEIKPTLNSPDRQGRTKTELALDEVIQKTKERYEKFQEKADRKFHKSSSKILNAAISFKELIGAAAGLDPTQHAASVWAIVSLGLTVREAPKGG